jgi:L-alanine-DL-glutamate epimerase-like enolase superfamily enzyme
MSILHLPANPVIIERIDVIELGGHTLIRVRDRDGACGYSTPNQHLRYLRGILHELVIPRFVGGDARELEGLVDKVPTWGSTYKLAGLALWCPVGWVETAVLDLLGRRTGRRVAELLGGVQREEMPIYISSTRRDTTPEQEVDVLPPNPAESAKPILRGG